MRKTDFFQYAIIVFAALILAIVIAFVYRELFPEYKVYQHNYQKLENFRSSYTHEKPAPFYSGIKQIVLVNQTKGPEVVDRCISCHVALDLPHFSPTRVAFDVNHKPIVDTKGNFLLEPNPDYVWTHLDQRIEALAHPAVLEELRCQGKAREAHHREEQAKKLLQLKTVQIAGRTVSVEKVIKMHPLIGAESRPFEYHPMEKYGCTSCHGGNGHALCAERAHGPVFDGEYEPAHMGPRPQFTEIDAQNDPIISKMYNHKPGHALIFQTTPLLAGPLVEAKCVQCHQSTTGSLQSSNDKFFFFADQRQKVFKSLQLGIENSNRALATLATLQELVEQKGREETLDVLKASLESAHLNSQDLQTLKGQIAFVEDHEEIAVAIEKESQELLDSKAKLQASYEQQEKVILSLQAAKEPLLQIAQDEALLKNMRSDVDCMLTSYSKGKELFITQGCYACHRIAGFSRNNVGPELTKAALSYPWYIKESIVWPQADLPTSTMPNFRLDHEELGCLMTFLMAQRGDSKAISEVDYQIGLTEWEKGSKMPWEKAVAPTQIKNVREAQICFATEGCASCHKLKGFESNVSLLKDKEWFYELVPEHTPGSKLAKIVEENALQIDQGIVAREENTNLLEEIDKKFPGLIVGFYTNFKFAARAFDGVYRNAPEKLHEYKERLKRVLMVYVQEYGLGREIAPNLSWSGVFRGDEWLLGHFHSPTVYTPKSLMPAMPFDDTKFYMLSSMLHELGSQNREILREKWQAEGFNPSFAFQTLCSSCHGEQRQGNGKVAEWIFPIPKNLRDPVFLSQLTKEKAIESVTHGVKGTPMPPWGEAAATHGPPVLTKAEIAQLVDWLYQGVASNSISKKWKYDPDDVVEEMQKEKSYLEPCPQKAVDAYFEEKQSPNSDDKQYYIRDVFYTHENLQLAEELYLVNCAICHGKEGAGTGVRASTMVEAKPRVFTDLPWIRAQDDLFLLRSIKYGVPGTAMVPWGDQTTSAQRMALTLFIRNLSHHTLKREEFQEILYARFDRKILLVEEARAKSYAHLENLEGDLQNAQNNLKSSTEKLAEVSSELVGATYVKICQLKEELKQAKEKDQSYLTLITLIKEEKALYSNLSEQILAANPEKRVIELFEALLREEPLSYTLREGELHLKETSENEVSQQKIIELLDASSVEIQEKLGVETSKMRSQERECRIQSLTEEEKSNSSLKAKLNLQLADTEQIRQKQLLEAKKLQ